MAKLIVEAENVRYTIRYSRADAVRKVLVGNADIVEDIKPTLPSVKTKRAKKKT